MTCNVFGGTLNLTQSSNEDVCLLVFRCFALFNLLSNE